jgi:arabinose-5-phosphate isomerase
MNKKKIINIAKEVISTEIAALKKLQKSIGKSFYQAINLISNSNGRIICCGVGKSAKILEKISSTLSSIGISSFTLDPTDAGHGSLGAIKKHDILIIASFSGGSIELNNILKYAKKNAIRIIGISSNPLSNLIQLSNIKIIMPKVIEAGNKNLNMIPTSSSTNLLALGDCLAISLASRNNFNKKKFGKLHPSGSLGKNLSEISEIMITGNKIPIVSINSKIKDVVLKISIGKLGCVVVVKNKKICGFISDGDMSRAIKKYHNIFDKKANDIMSKKPKTISSKCLIIDALKIMNKEKITTLVIAKNKKILGLVHLHNILSYLNS